jgi:hypothetical protein
MRYAARWPEPGGVLETKVEERLETANPRTARLKARCQQRVRNLGSFLCPRLLLEMTAND